MLCCAACSLQLATCESEFGLGAVSIPAKHPPLPLATAPPKDASFFWFLCVCASVGVRRGGRQARCVGVGARMFLHACVCAYAAATGVEVGAARCGGNVR